MSSKHKLKKQLEDWYNTEGKYISKSEELLEVGIKSIKIFNRGKIYKLNTGLVKWYSENSDYSYGGPLGIIFNDSLSEWFMLKYSYELNMDIYVILTGAEGLDSELAIVYNELGIGAMFVELDTLEEI